MRRTDPARSDRTDPTTIDPDDIDLPSDFGERLRTVFGYETRPSTYGEWVQRVVASFETERERSLTTEDLCDTDDSPHSATRNGERTHYLCAQDPLLVGLLAEEPVTVRSAPPNREEPVRIRFTGDETAAAPGGQATVSIDVEPGGALLSFGVAPDATAPAELAPEAMYGIVCPYGHAFPDDEAYDAWAAETDAVTDVLSARAGIAVMAELIGVAGVSSLA